MTSPRLDSGAGVTLIELMFALVIVGIGILTLSAVQTHSSRDVTVTSQHTRALSLAQTQVENAKVAGFDAAVSDSGVSGIYNWRREVTNAGQGLSLVRVTVAWTSQGTPRGLEVNTLLSTR